MPLPTLRQSEFTSVQASLNVSTSRSAKSPMSLNLMGSWTTMSINLNASAPTIQKRNLSLQNGWQSKTTANAPSRMSQRVHQKSQSTQYGMTSVERSTNSNLNPVASCLALWWEPREATPRDQSQACQVPTTSESKTFNSCMLTKFDHSE